MQWHNISHVEVLVRWVKELVCGYGDEGSIPFNDILNLVLKDYRMATYFYLSIGTLYIIVLDTT
jgi:hypothetical protein